MQINRAESWAQRQTHTATANQPTAEGAEIYKKEKTVSSVSFAWKMGQLHVTEQA